MMFKRISMTLAVAMFALLNVTPLSATAHSTIEGIVRISGSRAPLPHAKVTLSPGGYSTWTNPAGRFAVRVRRPGQYTIEIQHPACVGHSSQVFVRAGRTTKVTIGLRRQAVEVQRATCDKEPNRPITAAKISKEGGKAHMGVMSQRSKAYRFASQGFGSIRHRGIRRGGGGRRAMLAFAAEHLNREGYAHTPDSSFHHAQQKPLSTFSIDVDTASYSNVRRFLMQNKRLPPADAVRIEEMLNYFPYDTSEPVGKDPFAVSVELTEAPWNPRHKIARIAIQGKKVAQHALPPANLVFLVDVSGSMHSPNKLPLLKRSLAALVRQLRPQDKVSIVVYAGAAGVVLPPTAGDRKELIVTALNRLRAGGSTAGGAGLRLAYDLARKSAGPGTNNRVILCTDGDFNVGQSSDGELVRMIEKQRQSNVFLTVLGFGRGNYQDAKMQLLADKGNGNHAYIDSDLEARKVLVNNMGGTLLTIAKDVKIQVEFNPKRVGQYRLIGYANRKLAARDFKDDKKDAGELGSGHHVTALYELIPPQKAQVSKLRYQTTKASAAANAGELMLVKLRWKQPKSKRSTLRRFPIADLPNQLQQSSSDQRFALAVALFGMKLRGSTEAKSVSWQEMMSMAQKALGEDRGGYRKDFLKLIGRAAALGS